MTSRVAISSGPNSAQKTPPECRSCLVPMHRNGINKQWKMERV